MFTPEQVQNYGLWVQSGAIFVSFVGVIITATVNRGIARRRATLDLITAEQSTELLLDIRQNFIAMRDAGNLSQYTTQPGSDAAKTLRSVLNRYELVAIGIKEKTLSAKVYKEYARSVVVKDWCACRAFVHDRRTKLGNPKAFIEFERLAKKWATSDEKKNC